MGLLQSLMMLVLPILVSLLPFPEAESTIETPSTARSLDALLQDYAYNGFGHRPKTGIPYDGLVPSNLTGLKVSALRLRSGSFRRRGVKTYKEFTIPAEVTVTPHVERLALVYHNLGNWSELYYPMPGYSYLAPVVGLLAYDARNLSAIGLSKLDIKASQDPISVVFRNVKSAPAGRAAKCVQFDLKGLSVFSNVTSGNRCSTVQQGHFAIIVESAPIPVEVSIPSGVKDKKLNNKVWIAIGSVLGGLLLLGLLAFLVMWAHKFKNKRRMQQMETSADVGEPLHMASVGETKAPAANVTRTQPVLENECVS